MTSAPSGLARNVFTGTTLVLVGLGAGRLAAQERCRFVAPSGDLRRQVINATPTVRVQTPHLVCADGTVAEADSARHIENIRYFQLFGNASFENSEISLSAETIRLWRVEGRVEADGNARLRRKSDGAVITGDDLEFLQAEVQRPYDQLTVTGGRPHATIYPRRDSVPEGTPPDTSVAPYEIDADRLRFEGENRMVASGNARLERDSLTAESEGMEYNRLEGLLAFRSDAHLTRSDYDLRGDSIRGALVNDDIRELHAFEQAVLVGEDLRAAGPRIVLLLPEGEVERIVATRKPNRTAGPPGLEVPTEPEAEGEEAVDLFERVHPSRPVFTAEDLAVVGDSVDVRAPGGILERLVAVGRARAESVARDSLNTPDTPEIARRDWLEGDTLTANFVRVPAPPPVEVGPPERDTLQDEYPLESLVAKVGARSLYRTAVRDSSEVEDREASPPDTTAGAAAEGSRPGRRPPRIAIDHARGDTIRIVLREGELVRMEVIGNSQGWHFEPRTAPPDSAAPPPDTTGTSRGTTARAETTVPSSGPSIGGGGRGSDDVGSRPAARPSFGRVGPERGEGRRAR